MSKRRRKSSKLVTVTVVDRFDAARLQLGYTQVTRPDGGFEWTRGASVMTAGAVRGVAAAVVFEGSRAGNLSATDHTQTVRQRVTTLMSMLAGADDADPVPHELAVPAVRLLAEVAAYNEGG